MPLLLLGVVIVLACIALIPVSLIQRFRMGTMRRRAIGWIILLNAAGTAISTLFFLFSAAIASRWFTGAFTATVVGLAAGSAAGVLGLALTRWDTAGGRLYYTPNRWLVLAITLVVAGRVLYGFYRTYEAWRATLDRLTWVAASGVAMSMSAGAIVLGYYLVYWIGVRRHSRS
jgi:hypothetical protein